MKKSLLVFAILALVIGCVSQKKYDDLEARYYMALQENMRNNDRSNQLEAELSAMQEEVNRLQSELDDAMANHELLQNDFEAILQENSHELQINAQKNRELLEQLEQSRAELTQKENELNSKIRRINELESLIAQQKQILSNLKNSLSQALKNFEGKGITVQERNGKIYVSMENKLLFASGKWEVQPEGVTALNDLSSVLKNQKDLEIIIEGHTDNVPYATKSNDISDNWDLSVMRATSITKILESKGVSPHKMTAAGRSKYVPIGDNSTEAGKTKNRRVEIIIAPNLDKINQLLNKL